MAADSIPAKEGAAEAPAKRAAGESVAPARRNTFRKALVVVGIFVVVIGACPAWRRVAFARHFAEAREKLAAKEFPAAIAEFEKAASWQPARADAAYWLAVSYRRSGKLDKVEDQLKKAERLGWNKDDVRRQRLLLKAQIGGFNEVEADLRELFAQDLDDEAALEVYEALAHGYWASHRINDAVRCLDFWIKWRPRDIDPRLLRAEAYTDFNDPTSAEKEYRTVLKVEPAHRGALLALGRLLLEQGRVEAAAEQYQKCLAAKHETAEVFAGLAECEYRSGNADRAGELLARIDRDSMTPERHAQMLNLEADIKRFQKQPQEAVKLLKNAIDLWPHDSGIHQSLGLSYAAVGDKENANRHLEKGREITARADRFNTLQRQVVSHPDSADLRGEIGDILQKQGLMSDAATWWRSALRIDPRHQVSHEGLASFYEAEGERELAAKHRQAAEASQEATFTRAWTALQQGDVATVEKLRQALERRPELIAHANLLAAGMLLKERKFKEAHQKLQGPLNNRALRHRAIFLAGEALVSMGEPLMAEPLFLEAVRNNPSSLPANRWLSVIYYDLGAVDQARFYLERVAELDPADYRPDRLLGLMNKDYEVYDDAVKHYKRSLQRAPQQPPREEVLLELVECQIRMRDYEDALATLDEAAPSIDKNVFRAECLYNTGKRDEALALLDDALSQKPDHLQALLIRGDAALVEKDSARATACLKKAVELHPHDFAAHYKFAQALALAGDEAGAEKERVRADELKAIREKFARLHEKAFAEPYNSAVRRELSAVATQMGREDLAKVWLDAAASIEKVAGDKPANETPAPAPAASPGP
jgi:tetratricopeptide (TPR) repeat protein